MHEYWPILTVGAIIGVFAVIFLLTYLMEKNKRETMGFERTMKDKEIIRRLMHYAKPYWKSFIAVFVTMTISIAYDLASPYLIGHIEKTIKDAFSMDYLLKVVAVYAGILIVSLICTYIQAMILQ